MPNTNRTKQELAQSLKTLMQTMPLERISVGDIVECAGLGRNTFYYHFQDKYDLVNWIFESETDHMLRQRLTIDNWDPYLQDLEDYFRANQAFYCNALDYSGQNCLADHIYDTLRQRVIEQGMALSAEERQGLTDAEINTISEVVACIFLGLLVHWVQGGMPRDLKTFHECLRRILDGSLVHVWLRSGEKAEAQPAKQPDKQP